MYKALILDDEPRPINVLRHALKAHPEVEIVSVCRTLESARLAIPQNNPDIVFLDIEVNRQKVFPLVNELWQQGYTPAVIFVTGYGETHRKEAMETCELLFQWSYLSKPIRDIHLAKVIRKFRTVRERKHKKEGRLLIKTRTSEFHLPFGEIVYCESNGNYVNLYQLTEGRVVKRIWPGSLTSLLKNTLTTEKFLRISSKHAVNRGFFHRSADRRATCVLNRHDLPKEIELRVPENWRKGVWGELLR
jgi:DNA-binding LytR/AlgR family response regulator